MGARGYRYDVRAVGKVAAAGHRQLSVVDV
jgi:hypothetical protein